MLSWSRPRNNSAGLCIRRFIFLIRAMLSNDPQASKEPTPEVFTLWATSDAHIVREALAESGDPAAVPRESMRIAVEQADSHAGFNYDIGVHLG